LQQVWDMVEKLQLKDAELQENQNEIQYLKEQVEAAETQTGKMNNINPLVRLCELRVE